MKRELLRVEHITKAFNDVYALKDFSFSLYEGDVLGLAGLNNSGKTTLTSILNGSQYPDSGTIIFKGMHTSIPSTKAARDMGIYYISQQSDLMPHLSISENLFLLKNKTDKMLTANSSKDLKKARIFLQEIGLSFDAETLCRDLTMAQQHLIQIAKALLMRYHLIIIDNITTSYSPHEMEQFLKLLQNVRQNKSSVIFISQQLQQLFAASSRILVLRDGYSAGTLFPDEYSKEKLLNLLVGYIYKSPFTRKNSNVGTEVFSVKDLCTKTLHNVTFSVGKGEILGINDISSTNTSSLFHLFSGTETVYSGSIYLCGQKVSSISPRAMLQNRVGLIDFSQQQNNFFPNFTIIENINLLRFPRLSKFPGIISPRLTQYTREEIAKTLSLPGEFLDCKFSSLDLSREQEIVILLERWRLAFPDVLFLSGIFQDLDVVARRRIASTLEALSMQGTALILLASDFPDIRSLFNRILYLENGYLQDRG